MFHHAGDHGMARLAGRGRDRIDVIARLVDDAVLAHFADPHLRFRIGQGPALADRAQQCRVQDAQAALGIDREVEREVELKPADAAGHRIVGDQGRRHKAVGDRDDVASRRPQPGRAPIRLDDPADIFAEPGVDVDPVARSERPFDIERDARRGIEDKVLDREADDDADRARGRPDAHDGLVEHHADDAGQGQQEDHDAAQLHDQARRHAAHRMHEQSVPDEDANHPADDQRGSEPQCDIERTIECRARRLGKVQMRRQRFEIKHAGDGRRQQDQGQIKRPQRAQAAHGQIQGEGHRRRVRSSSS